MAFSIRPGAGLIPDFGLSERFFGRGKYAPQQTFSAPYGFTPTPIQQKAIISYPYSSQPSYTRPAGPQTFAPQSSTKAASLINQRLSGGNVTPQQTTQAVREAGVNIPKSAPKSAPKSTPTVSQTTSGGTNNENVIPNLTDEQKQALQIAKQEGIGEGWTDEERANEIIRRKQELEAQVGQAYSGVENALNELESIASQGLDEILGGIGNEFGLARENLGTAQEQILGGLGKQEQQTKKGEANALSAARQLYRELGQANRQRYGGASSTGQFASQLQGREFQHNVGGIQDAAAANLAEIRDRATQVRENYQQNLKDLDLRKSQAMTDARQAFNDRLFQVKQMREASQQAKANTALQLLQDYRNQVLQIQLNDQQYRRQIEQNAMNIVNQMKANIAQFQTQEGRPVNLTGLPQSEFSSIVPTQTVVSPVLPTGLIKRLDEEAGLA